MAESELRYRGKTKNEVDDKDNDSTDQDKVENTDKEEEVISDLTKTFWLTRIVFLRGLAFIYFVAFLVSFNQNKELIGDNGLLPAKLYLSRIKDHHKTLSNLALFFQFPTLDFLPELYGI